MYVSYPCASQFRRKNTDRRIKRMHYSMSLFVLYFGTDRQYEHMAHHEILLGPRYRGLLDDIFYFVGAGTHPGAGLLGVMSSGKIVADLLS